MKRTLHPYFSLVVGLLGISFIICIHEFGHLLTAKYFGVRVPVFSIGFGPALIWKTIGDTTYQIAILLLGGYVQINLDDLSLLPYWKKMVIMFAGIFVNFIFALGTLFALLFAMRRSQPSNTIEQVIPQSPADKAGIKVNDDIDITRMTQSSVAQLQDEVNQSVGKTINFYIKRGSQQLQIPVTVEKHPFYGNQAGYAGLLFKNDPHIVGSIGQSLKNAYKTLVLMTKTVAKSIVSFGSKDNRVNIVGPIGIVQMTGNSAQQGWHPYLFLLAIISLQIAFFNLLPIPFFDGGQIARYTLEAIMGKSFSPQLIGFINFIALVLFLAFIFYLSRSDMRLFKKEKSKN